MAQISRIITDRPFALLANSLGGLLARHVRAELREQVVGMALIAPVVDSDPTCRRVPDFRVLERDEALLQSLGPEDRRDFTAMTPRQTRQAWNHFRTFALPGIRAADAAAMANLAARYFVRAHPEERAGVFDGPTLVLAGRQGHVVGYEDQFDLVRTWYPAATYAVINDAGHNVHLDSPERSALLVRTWADDLPRLRRDLRR